MKERCGLLIVFLCLLLTFSCKKEAGTPADLSSIWETYGLGSTVLSGKSLNKNYNYYYDQFDGSQYQYINCGPAVTTMAIKWADSAFSKKPADARNIIPENGDWWYTSDIVSYLRRNQVNSSTVPFTSANGDNVITTSIDNNDLVILCLDMYYASYNPIATQHTNKFYTTNAPRWGHFLLVKGYKRVDKNLYYEIYDPYTDHETYNDNSPKGKDRYYLNSTITAATDAWWKYAIIVAQKGSTVTSSISHQVNSMPEIPVAKGQ
jgi:hypothetical protein